MEAIPPLPEERVQHGIGHANDAIGDRNADRQKIAYSPQKYISFTLRNSGSAARRHASKDKIQVGAQSHATSEKDDGERQSVKRHKIAYRRPKNYIFK